MNQTIKKRRFTAFFYEIRSLGKYLKLFMLKVPETCVIIQTL